MEALLNHKNQENIATAREAEYYGQKLKLFQHEQNYRVNYKHTANAAINNDPNSVISALQAFALGNTTNISLDELYVQEQKADPACNGIRELLLDSKNM